MCAKTREFRRNEMKCSDCEGTAGSSRVVQTLAGGCVSMSLNGTALSSQGLHPDLRPQKSRFRCCSE
jgi:hypothetical protein